MRIINTIVSLYELLQMSSYLFTDHFQIQQNMTILYYYHPQIYTILYFDSSVIHSGILIYVRNLVIYNHLYLFTVLLKLYKESLIFMKTNVKAKQYDMHVVPTTYYLLNSKDYFLRFLWLIIRTVVPFQRVVFEIEGKYCIHVLG